jgi:hypothetical protein
MKALLWAIPVLLILGCEKSDNPLSTEDEKQQQIASPNAITCVNLDTTLVNPYSWIIRWTITNTTAYNIDSVGYYLKDSVRQPNGSWICQNVTEEYLGQNIPVHRFIGRMSAGQKNIVQFWSMKHDNSMRHHLSVYWKQ